MNLHAIMIKFLVALVSFSALAVPAAAYSEYEIQGDLYTQHQVLWNAIKSVGVKAYLNPPGCKVLKKDGISGMYFPGGKYAGRLVVCQNNYNPQEGKAKVNWTEDDLNTLRHEAHHLVQDCRVGGFGDGKGSILFDEEGLANFVLASGLSKSRVETIVSEYKTMDYKNDEILMELEAFAAAKAVPAHIIAKKVVEFCSSHK